MAQEAALLRERIGRQMQELEGRQRPRERAQLAQVAERSPRTLRTWKKNPRGGRPGRPPHSLRRERLGAQDRDRPSSPPRGGRRRRRCDRPRAQAARDVPTRLTREFGA